jgi:pimeloyl-ACP methyl ester carboxylesterase
MNILTPRGRLRYRQAGTGPAVLLLHGAGGSSALWIGTLRRFARSHTLYAPDLPGHGRSEGSTTSFEDLLQATGEFAAAACVGRAILVGHSLGGLLALAAAVRWPDQIAGLVLVSTAGKLHVSSRFLARIENDWPAFPTYMAELAHSPDTPGSIRRRSVAIGLSSIQVQTQADFSACNEYDATPHLGSIRVPSLVISGADDLLLPTAHSAALAAGIGAPHVVLDRCGHFPMHERPDRFFAALANGLGPGGH